MNYAKITKTKTGWVWLVNAEENEIYPQQFQNKIAYQRAVTDLIVQDKIGDNKVIRLENGAPKLEGLNSHISISHSHGWFAVYFSHVNPVGVDLEFIKRDLQSKKEYFLNDFEQVKSWTNTELHLIWCAKEVVFKLEQGDIESLMRDVSINKISKSRILASFGDSNYELSYVQFADGIMVYS